jgi:hypothetical protein
VRSTAEDASFGVEGGHASAIKGVAIAREPLHVRIGRHFVKAGPMGAEYVGMERSRDPAEWLKLAL